MEHNIVTEETKVLLKEVQDKMQSSTESVQFDPDYDPSLFPCLTNCGTGLRQRFRRYKANAVTPSDNVDGTYNRKRSSSLVPGDLRHRMGSLSVPNAGMAGS